MTVKIKELNRSLPKPSEVLFFLQKEGNTLISLIMLTSGTIIGTYFILSSSYLNTYKEILEKLDSCSAGILQLIFILLILTMNFISGLSCVGTPIVSVNCLLSGFITGFSGVYYISYHSESIKCYIRVIVIFLISVYTAEISYRMSEKISRKAILSIREEIPLKQYLLSYFIALSASVIIIFLLNL